MKVVRSISEESLDCEQINWRLLVSNDLDNRLNWLRRETWLRSVHYCLRSTAVKRGLLWRSR